MKKAIIAAGASAVLAAMPVAASFAATNMNTITDVLQATVPDSCSMTGTAATGSGVTGEVTGTGDLTATYTFDITNGATKIIPGTTISVTCNDNQGWMVNAVGGSDFVDSDTNAHKDAMVPSTATNTAFYSNGSSASDTVGDVAATTASFWAMKLTAGSTTSAATIDGNYDSWSSIPVAAAGTKVAHGGQTHMDSTTPQAAQFTTSYEVHVSMTQEADTYTGSVIYQLAHPNE